MFINYSPVAKFTFILLLLALVTIKKCHLKQLDVDNTFLCADLSEEFYMILPPKPNPTRYSINKIFI